MSVFCREIFSEGRCRVEAIDTDKMQRCIFIIGFKSFKGQISINQERVIGLLWANFEM
jgi:hypothetical protein